VKGGQSASRIQSEGRCIPRFSSGGCRLLEIVDKVWRLNRRDALGAQDMFNTMELRRL
jgi:hypothetical protein